MGTPATSRTRVRNLRLPSAAPQAEAAGWGLARTGSSSEIVATGAYSAARISSSCAVTPAALRVEGTALAFLNWRWLLDEHWNPDHDPRGRPGGRGLAIPRAGGRTRPEPGQAAPAPARLTRPLHQ